MTDREQLLLGAVGAAVLLISTIINVVPANRMRKREEREFDRMMAEREDAGE